MGGLVELDRALGILAEHTVDDTDVEVEVSVERCAEAMKKLPRTVELSSILSVECFQLSPSTRVAEALDVLKDISSCLAVCSLLWCD